MNTTACSGRMRRVLHRECMDDGGGDRLSTHDGHVMLALWTGQFWRSQSRSGNITTFVMSDDSCGGSVCREI